VTKSRPEFETGRLSSSLCYVVGAISSEGFLVVSVGTSLY